jgi:hypothetical protein
MLVSKDGKSHFVLQDNGLAVIYKNGVFSWSTLKEPIKTYT